MVLEKSNLDANFMQFRRTAKGSRILGNLGAFSCQWYGNESFQKRGELHPQYQSQVGGYQLSSPFFILADTKLQSCPGRVKRL
jgi:hypothetical protein